MNFRRKGFTLIELLVVISIIALLASVVLAALNQSRNKAADSSVKEGLHSIRNQAEIFYTNSDPHTYGPSAVCTPGSESGVWADQNVINSINSIKSQADPSASVNCSTDSVGEKWAIAVTKLKNSGTSWCIDSSGWVGAADTTPGSGVCATLISGESAQGNYIWSAGQSYGDISTAYNYCLALNEGGFTWRLPSPAELHNAFGAASGFSAEYYRSMQMSGGGNVVANMADGILTRASPAGSIKFRCINP